MRRLTAGYIALTILVGVAIADRPIGRSKPVSATYDRYCTACHGELGDGRGPAAPFTWGRPRAFTTEELKYNALDAAIRYGIPGTSMPAFDGVLSRSELADVYADVMRFAPTYLNTSFALPTFSAVDRERGAELWKSQGCATCHGVDGKGDGPAATTWKPYDLTALPLHRPRKVDDLAARRTAVATSITLGIKGTPMPAYQLPDRDLWALADHVVAINANAKRTSIALDVDAISRDRESPLDTAIWPGTGSDAAIWGTHLAPQGPPPETLAPAQASLSAQQCGRCHAKQFREWSGSLHGAAGSPGLYAQLDAGIDDTCRRCHAPLAEQINNMRDEGVTCAGCHVRKWTRNGPGHTAASLLQLPSYPKQDRAIYERADFCMPCHQLPPRNGLGGKPLLNTYKEWLEGPYMKRGVQCQHCHMPNREHQWLGIHDRATFVQGVKLSIDTRHTDRGASVVAELANVGAGHYLPTTPTPAVWLRIELLDRDGVPIAGARDELRIGRDLMWDGAWHERADTRIPPGEKVTFAKAWQGGRAKQAVTARVTVEVWPDAYYEGFYKLRVAEHPTPAIRALYDRAIDRATKSHYIAETRDVAIQ